MLTRKQSEILNFIKDFYLKNQRGPKIEEIADFFKKSTSTIFFHLDILRRKGFIKSFYGENLPIEVSNNKSQEIIEIPLLGYISAGYGIENIENPEIIKIHKNMISSTGQHYALRVRGKSMIDAGILDGDIILVRHQNYADNGDIVVALFKENTFDIKATIKKFYNRGSKIELVPMNPDPFYKSIWVKRGDIEIRGKFVGLIR